MFETIGGFLGNGDVAGLARMYDSYCSGCEDTKSEPEDADVFMEILRDAYEVIQKIAHAVLVDVMNHDFSEVTVSRAKSLINEADEDIPGAKNNIERILLEKQPNLLSKVPFETIWSKRHRTEVFQTILFSLCEDLHGK